MPEEHGSEPLGETTELKTRVSTLETKMSFLLAGTGLTLVVVVGVAFWFGSLLGTLNVTTSKASEKVDKVYAVVWENENSLATRAVVMQKQLDSIDKNVTDLTKLRERTSLTIRQRSAVAPK